MTQQATLQQISAVDLFCGAGGLTHGLIKAGTNVTAGVDIDVNCKYAYEANNEAIFVEKDIRDITGEELRQYFMTNTIKLLAGCAPCQPFSTYSQKRRKVQNDQKWDLLLDFGRLVYETQPELVTMENVPQLQDHPVFKIFLAKLEGYHIWHKVVECTEYDIPQTRKRLVLLASKLGPIELIPPTCKKNKPKTVREVLAALPPLNAGRTDALDPLHTASSLSELNLQRIIASRPGGTWRDWPADLRAKCHKRESGQTYPSVYGRMEWDAPAPTITTQCFGYGNGRFGHPEQNRAISLREAAILQTFPRDYKFIPYEKKVSFNVLGRLIGNAVPVRLGEIVGKSLFKHLAEHQYFI